MKLAEALSLRADLQKRVIQLKVRLKDSAKIQEGDEPAEDVKELYPELDNTLAELEELIYRINETNIRTMHEGENLTRLMARKDVLTQRVSLMRDVLKHVVENDTRYGRNEVKYIRLVDVSALRKETDNYASQLRELDMRIQSLNWTGLRIWYRIKKE
mgnify:CR=1 FL=1